MQRETGASVRIFNLAKGLLANGNNVRVVLPRCETTTEHVDGVTVYGLRGILPIAVLEVLSKFVHVGRPTALWFYDILFISRIGHLVRDADVVQIEAQSSGLFLIPFVRKVLKKPVVVDCHDVFQALRLKHASFTRKILETFLEKLAYKHADLLLVVSEDEKKRLFSAGFKQCHISVVPNGVDNTSCQNSLTKSAVREKYDLCDDPVVVFVGNLDYPPNREALHILSSVVVPKVQSEIANVRFVVVGKAKSKLSLPGLIFTGFVDNVSDILKVSEVAVAPLLQGSGTRLKILEYLSCGLPVVSTSVGAEGLDVQNGVNILIDDDFDSFGLRVAFLLRNKDIASSLGERGRILAVSKYDWKNITTKLERDYGAIIARRTLYS